MSYRAIALGFCCLLVAGCGFRPLYGDFGQDSVASAFLTIEVGTTKDREGQLLRNALLRQLHGNRPSLSPAFRLETKLSESTTSLAVKKSAFATRANLTMTATFDLVSFRTANSVFSSTSNVTVSYNILDSEFGTTLAEQNARQRAIRELAHDMRIRLGGFLDRVGQSDR